MLIPTARIAACNNCGCSQQETVGTSPDFEYSTCDNEFVFVRCVECGLVYLRDRPTADCLDTIYPPNYIPYHWEQLSAFVTWLRNRVQRRKIDPLLARLGERATVVDVGPGNGELLALIRRYGRPGWKLYGVDFAEAAVEAVRRRGIEAIQAQFEHMEWRDQPPDAIVMNQVIEHLDDPAAVVRKAHNILAPGGYLFIETPSVDAWDFRLFHQRHWGGWHTPRHWTLYEPRSLAFLLRRHGFVVEETKHLLSPNFWLQSIHHRLIERGHRRLARLFDVSFLPALAAASALDVAQAAISGRTSNFRMIARRSGA